MTEISKGYFYCRQLLNEDCHILFLSTVLFHQSTAEAQDVPIEEPAKLGEGEEPLELEKDMPSEQPPEDRSEVEVRYNLKLNLLRRCNVLRTVLCLRCFALFSLFNFPLKRINLWNILVTQKNNLQYCNIFVITIFAEFIRDWEGVRE